MVVAALLLALAALAEASCALPGRHSLRELLTPFAEYPRQSGLDLQRLQGARAGVQAVELLVLGCLPWPWPISCGVKLPSTR